MNKKEKDNSEFKPVKLRLNIDLMSYPARAEGLVNMNCEQTEQPGILETIYQSVNKTFTVRN